MAEILVENLYVSFDEKKVLQGISLAVSKGEVVALIGPTGSGKTTFLRTLNRMNPEEDLKLEGTVHFAGENIYSPTCNVLQLRRRVGMIFPNPNPLPMPIFDNVAYGPRLHGIKERAKLAQIVEESLTEVGLWHELNRNLDSSALKLPKGQQQRLCIARTLAVDSEVLLMDEPCLNLDPISTTRINNLIHQLKQERTIIIATHDLQQAARIADRTAFFWEGELVEEAPTDELFQRPRDSRTEAYLTGRF